MILKQHDKRDIKKMYPLYNNGECIKWTLNHFIIFNKVINFKLKTIIMKKVTQFIKKYLPYIMAGVIAVGFVVAYWLSA